MVGRMSRPTCTPPRKDRTSAPHSDGAATCHGRAYSMMSTFEIHRGEIIGLAGLMDPVARHWPARSSVRHLRSGGDILVDGQGVVAFARRKQPLAPAWDC